MASPCEGAEPSSGPIPTTSHPACPPRVSHEGELRKHCRPPQINACLLSVRGHKLPTQAPNATPVRHEVWLIVVLLAL